MVQRQNDLESQKYLIGKLTEKITKTVKSEVEARYRADMDGKIFSQKINNKFENSLDILKKEIEEITNQTRAEMQNISRIKHGCYPALTPAAVDDIILPYRRDAGGKDIAQRRGRRCIRR